MLSSVNICGTVYDVRWSSKEISDDGEICWGVLSPATRELSMFGGLSERETKYLFCHEIYHEILGTLGIVMEEKDVKLTMKMLFDAIDRNNIFTNKVK